MLTGAMGTGAIIAIRADHHQPRTGERSLRTHSNVVSERFKGTQWGNNNGTRERQCVEKFFTEVCVCGWDVASVWDVASAP